ncbi:MAG: hypothetical protein EOP85_14720, partial [Verrucomicrobiaceae bacterium]
MKSRSICGIVFCSVLGLLSGTVHVQAQPQLIYPVITEVKIVFSMVSHHNTIPERIHFYDTFGDPQGNDKYAVPYLVYEPVVTLHNPYQEALTLNRCRVRISNPPIGFSFKKNNAYLRSDFATGAHHPLGRFQIANEQNTNAVKIFILRIRELDEEGAPGAPVVLQPGESKSFSTWVEPDWTWALETANGYTSRIFHDWDSNQRNTVRDPRTSNERGVETVPASSSGVWDYRGGFQTDMLSLSNGNRPANTLYPFESPQQRLSNFVVVKLTDSVTVEATPMRTTLPNQYDFKVDMLRDMADFADGDVHRSFGLVIPELARTPQPVLVTKTYQVGAILQKADDPTHGGKTPFAMFRMVAKPEAITDNQFYQSPPVPAEDLYSVAYDKLDGYPSLGFPDAPGAAPALEV